MLCSYSILFIVLSFVSIGPEKPHAGIVGVGNILFIYLLIYLFHEFQLILIAETWPIN